MYISKTCSVLLQDECPFNAFKEVNGFYLKPKRQTYFPNTLITGVLNGWDDRFIYLKITNGLNELSIEFKHIFYDIHFHTNRLPFQLQLNALKFIKTQNLFEILINNPLYEETLVSTNNDYDYEFTCNHQKLNDSQRKAVKNIVGGHKPIPFLLFGPPGTGKTQTIVSAIEEIVRSSTNCVLVCAQSNAACDEIAERLLNILKAGEVYRMYAKSYEKQTIGSKIRPSCNLHHGEIQFPSLQYLYQFRVVVCTLLTAGCLVRARDRDKDFDSSHFSHIFIDEAACTHEPVSMIPIAGTFHHL